MDRITRSVSIFFSVYLSPSCAALVICITGQFWSFQQWMAFFVLAEYELSIICLWLFLLNEWETGYGYTPAGSVFSGGRVRIGFFSILVSLYLV